MKCAAGFVLFAAILIASCGVHESNKDAPQPDRTQRDGSFRLTNAEQSVLGIEVQSVRERSLPNAAIRYGRVTAPPGSDTRIVAPVDGTIRRVARARIGDTVPAGTLIVELTPRMTEAEHVALRVQTADYQSQIAGTREDLSLREAEARRARALAKDGLISAAELQETETTFAISRAKLEGLERANQAQDTAQQAPVSVIAPGSGVLAELNASVGAAVASGELIARLVSAGPRWIDVAVAPEEAAGTAYEVQAGDRWVPAELQARGTVVRSDGMRLDRLEVAQRDALALLPGASVAVRVATTAAVGPVVPESAIVPAPGSDLVFLTSSAGLFTPCRISVIARFGGFARVEGLRSDEQVVVRGAMALRGEQLRTGLGDQD